MFVYAVEVWEKQFSAGELDDILSNIPYEVLAEEEEA
jgi:hypothetical protein